MSYEIEEIEVENDEVLEAIENEIEKYTEEQYDEMLDECGTVTAGGLEFYPSRILQELDPTAYSCGFNDFQEYETEYTCPICGNDHSDEDEAKFCCQEEMIKKYEVDGEEYDTEAEAQEEANRLNEEEENEA